MKNKNVITNSDYGTLLINRNDTIVGRIISVSGDYDCGILRSLEGIIRQLYPANSEIEIIDGGANIGIYSLYMARLKDFDVKVIAIEAQRLVYQMLNANIALNSLENVWTYHRVISDKNEEIVTLECPDLNFPASFGSYEVEKAMFSSDYDGIKFMKPEKVESITLDSLGLEKCALIKLDVEGMEDVALIGARKLIEKSRPMLFFERIKTDYQRAKNFLREYDYTLWEPPTGANVIAIRKETKITIGGCVRIDL